MPEDNILLSSNVKYAANSRYIEERASCNSNNCVTNDGSETITTWFFMRIVEREVDGWLEGTGVVGPSRGKARENEKTMHNIM